MNYRKSILSAYTNTPVVVETGGLLNFANAAIQTGCAIRFTPGSTTITLAMPGLYQVHVTANLTQTAAGTSSIQLYRNGVAMPCCVASADAATAENLSFEGLVNVNPSCPAVNNTTNLTVVNTGVGSTYTQFTITVVKIA